MQGIWLIAFVVQWLIVLILMLLVVGILRHLSAMQERWNLAAPPITMYELGQRIADFELADATGTKIQSKDLLGQSNGAVILFASASCSACETVLAHLSELVARRDISFTKTVVVIVLGPTGSLKRILDTYPSLISSKVVALADEEGIALSQFGLTSTPVGLAVDRDSRVVSQTLNPHAANWLYTRMETIPPEKPVSQGPISLVLPEVYLKRKG